MIVNKITGYKTSKDYVQLWELAQKQSIICIIGYGERCLRDISKTMVSNYGCNIVSRGMNYLEADCLEDFVEYCERFNVEWIAR